MSFLIQSRWFRHKFQRKNDLSCKGRKDYVFYVKDLEVRGNVYFHELLVVVWEINYSDMPRLAYFHYDVTVCVEYCASFLAGPHWVLTLIWTR